jgi:hypothetical protein
MPGQYDSKETIKNNTREQYIETVLFRSAVINGLYGQRATGGKCT